MRYSINFIIFVGITLISPACSFAGDPAMKPEINSYAECVAAGYPVMRSLPARCAVPGGQVFTEEREVVKAPPAKSGFCKDTCGDGSCAEMVCMAEGCPCAETQESCPQDCN